ncbi:putative disease resistance protein RGA3 isoform X2 [Malus sylvestris]|uniref:putative disease resistance protein RGA3 isoform X2 n=1 Tax=Malus sylvestris TaxID=3752 RepID=UPI0021ACAF82|nr:putative disease resistance protein RGA3 isoform X2 [Malus sylvestris]
MAEALVSGLTDRLVEKEGTQLAAVLREIQPLLEDAERRQLKEAFVRNWLCDLKDAVCDLEDVLDEWDTALLKIKIQKLQFGISGKVRFCILNSFLCFCQVRRVGQRRQIAVKLNELRERLSAIASDSGKYGFNSLNKLNNVGEIEQIKQPARLGTTSLIEESAIYGRDEDKKVLMSRLVSESSEDGMRRNVDVIPVVGMGGMGKTTLAQLVYNDDRVRTHFDLRIWVCVSHPFDVTKVAKAILEAILGQTQKLVELDLLIEHIHEAIAGKKFLLVLDDVWDEDSSKWELLRRPLDAGGVGSRILVTTRNKSVARMMSATGMITLGTLPEDDSWLIFSQIAFLGRDKSESKQLEEIGREIVRKCHGVPLAAKTMGALMRFKDTRREWEYVLHSLMWERKDVNTPVFDVLVLSYCNLSPALRRCFSYCAVFPKDYMIERDNLIKLWMSQGYLHFDRNKEKEILGREYFMDLVTRSLFQVFEKDHQGDIIRCKMHDIVHDFAQFLTKSECFIGVAEEYNLVTEKIRHCTFVRAPDAAFPVSTWNGNSLRTLLILGSTNTAINPAIFSHLSSLRTLDLSDCWFKELPEEIGEFMHLRYLNLSGNDELESLPEKLCDLSNLQTLLIKDCMRLRRLPEAMGKLVSLRHLHIDWSFNLERLPKGIARLTSLQTLDMFVVARCDKNEALQLGDLKKLNKLEGYIRICKCGNIENVGEAEKAELMYSKLLVNVKLDFDWSGERRLEDEIILECLQPHSNLEALEIRKYRGTTISPDWMMSLTNLRRLVLYSCQYSEALPPLGKLPSLESLEICLMKSVKNVGLEFLGIGTDGAEISSFVSFPKLSELRFCSLGKWKVWEGSVRSMEEDISCRIMPCLLSLEINSCFCLDVLPNFLKKTPLQNLTITDSKVLQDHCIVGTGKEWDTISHIPNIKINFESVQRDDL